MNSGHPMKRTVFFVSDGTGITAENLGQSLLTQFEQIEFDKKSFPYINDIEKANTVVAAIEQSYKTHLVKPLVFATLVNDAVHQIISKSPCLFFDFFKQFIDPLEAELQIKSSHTIGRTHGLINYQNYMQRINAVNYALANDDGINIRDFDQADFILIGASRSGKTPTCLYLALQFGMYAANYPLTEEDLVTLELPKCLLKYKNKLFGLLIDAQRLTQIRQERKPNSRYASLDQCTKEIQQAEKIYHREKIPYLSTTTRSIEEIATEILTLSGTKKRIF
jgi:regulator of PEP synthase PpsR (kinase-PPPase family)